MSVVGIDLGTTNTVVACVRDGRVHVLADDKGNRLLPSIVSFHPNGDVLVGPLAQERRLVDAKNTIASIKRLIGRPWDSDEMRLARSRFPFELREGPGQGALVIARGEAYTLPEISAFVLKRCRQIAEAALGETVDKAVITVPAHFNELQRASTKVAGRVAGLEVLRILNEPTAAALAYGFGSERSERVAVYDFGGGTFDCSLLDLTGSLFEVLATAGDTFLGGDDVDTAIAEVMCNAFLAQHRYDPRTDPQAFERLRAAAEQLKKDLSVNMQAQVDLPEVAYGIGGKRLGFTFGLTQADLDVLATPLVDRTLHVTQDSLNIAHLTPSSFDSVVLVGGSTRMPIVKRRVEAFFGIPVIDRVNPDEVVAVGAAVQAAALVDQTRKRGIPVAPRPGTIGPPQQVQQDEGATASQPSPVSTRGMAPPPVPPPVVKTLRPGPGGTSPMGAVPPQRPMADTTDDHSIGSGHTMPANQAGPPSMTNILDAFPFGNTTASNPVARSDQTLSSAPGRPPEPTLPSAQAPPPQPQPTRAGPSAPPKAWGPLKGMLRPLETEDISRIVPDAHPAAMRTRTSPSAPAPSLGARRPTGDVGPLETEDISMIVPEAHPGAMRAGRNPSAPPPGSTFGRPSDVAPLNTEDISMIVPERSNPGFRGPPGLPTARGPAAPQPFSFPPFPQAQQGPPAGPFAPPPFPGPQVGAAFAPSPFQLRGHPSQRQDPLRAHEGVRDRARPADARPRSRGPR